MPHTDLTAVNLVKMKGKSNGQAVTQPMPTVTSGAGAKRPAGAAHSLGLQAATLVRMNHKSKHQADPVDQPLRTVTTQTNKFNLAAATLVRANHGDKQWDAVDEPMRTVTAQGNKFFLVYAFLTKFFGTAVGQELETPIGTLTAKHRYGIVTTVIDGEEFIVADIGMRMLEPHELKLAQGFPEDYILTGPKYEQVSKIGNSVPPQMAEAVVRANLPRFCTRKKPGSGNGPKSVDTRRAGRRRGRVVEKTAGVRAGRRQPVCA